MTFNTRTVFLGTAYQTVFQSLNFVKVILCAERQKCYCRCVSVFMRSFGFDDVH